MSALLQNAQGFWYIYVPVTVASLLLVLTALPGLLRQRGQVAAIAMLSFRECVRKKALFAAAAGALVILASTPFVGALDQPGHKLKVVQTVCVISLNVFGCLVAIALGAFALPTDLADKTIYSVVTKPVRREALIAGKILGVVAVVLLTFLLMSLVSYAAIQRAACHESDPVVASKILSGRRLLAASKMTPMGQDEGKGVAVGTEDYAWLPGKRGMVEWAFEGLHKRRLPYGVVEAHLKAMVTSPDPSRNTIPVTVTVSDPDPAVGDHHIQLALPDDVATTFRIQAAWVSPTGDLRVSVRGDAPDDWMAVTHDGLQIEAQPSSFASNFARAMLMLACQLVLIVVVSVAGSTFLSSHVSALFSIFVVFCGYINDFVSDLAKAAFVAIPTPHVHGGQAPPPPGWFLIVANNALKEFLKVFGAVTPDFREFSVGPYLVEGLYVSPLAVVSACGYMLFYGLIGFAVARAVMLGKELA